MSICQMVLTVQVCRAGSAPKELGMNQADMSTYGFQDGQHITFVLATDSVIDESIPVRAREDVAEGAVRIRYEDLRGVRVQTGRTKFEVNQSSLTRIASAGEAARSLHPAALARDIRGRVHGSANLHCCPLCLPRIAPSMS